MKKLILISLILLILTSCMSLVPERVKNEYALDWALENGYIRAEDCPELEIPERQALPHPIVPLFQTVDEDGDPIPITQKYLMNIVIQLFGTVEKFQYLVEIYEREYLNEDGRIMPDLTLEELKALYEERLSTIEKTRREIEPEESVQPEGTTSSVTPGEQLTIDQFEELLGVWNSLNEEYNTEDEIKTIE